jgi:ABC-2 type transport system ATP-binding protein/ribosome-dependent ATPase
VPQSLGLYDDLTVAENWEFTAAAFGIADSKLPESFAGCGNELVGDLSLGLQRRVAFAVAFSHDPELLVLDEPTSGVGPLSSARLWDDIRASAERGAGVLVTTHNMMEAEQCDRLVVMTGGRVVATGTLGQVIGDRHVSLVACNDWQRAFTALDGDGLIVQVQGDHLRVPGAPERVTEILRRHGLEGEVSAVAANLEEAFVDIVSNTTLR